jgi:DNA-binding SARP family transcriptional activator
VADLDYRILGPLEVWEGERRLPLGGGKQRALLAILLLEANRVVSTDRLIEELWPERPPGRPQTAVQGYVSDLRKVLELKRGPDEPFQILTTRGPGYLLRVDPAELDLRRFERLLEEGTQALAEGRADRAALTLREALALWRGPPLADFTYEPWAQSAIARLEELCLACLEERIEADLAVGRHGELVGELEALVAEHLLRERLHGQLMIALYRSGRQAEALNVYQRARRTLVDELGIDPTLALQQLEKRILTQDSSLDLAPAAVGRPAPPQPAPPPDRSILVVARNRAQLRSLLPLAELLAGAKEPHEILVARLVPARADPLPPGDLLADASAELEQEREALLERGVHARVAVFTSIDPGEDLVRLAARPEVDLLLLAADRAVLVDGRLSDEARRVLAEVPSHVGLWVKREGIEVEAAVAAIGVPFGGAEHDWAAVEVAAWAASAKGVALRLIGTAADTEAGRRDASRLLADAALLIQRASDVVPKPVLIRPGREGIVEACKGVSLLVVGLSERWAEEGLGMLRWALARTAPVPVLFVRGGLRPSGLAPAHTVGYVEPLLGRDCERAASRRAQRVRKPRVRPTLARRARGRARRGR